jgi:2-polyprenyl-3-methyl-5-hydroxy-6-metoxy-1,4-benzoquinol methylase
LANAAGTLSLADARNQFAWSSLLGGVSLAPGGVLVTGSELIRQLEEVGFRSADAVSVVFAIRLATVGVSTALGVVMLGVHFASRRAGSHFDEIAHAYDAQIPADRRDALLTRKTTLMRSVLQRYSGGGRGLDVGCGQGWYVARMRLLGFDVEGIDASPGQIAIAAGQAGSPALIRMGSVLDIPAADGSYDFVYIINVLHHLDSIEDQRKAFAEMSRVLRQGGLLFVHEINTRNPLFRFYMGYVFPTLNCIDEGVERWLLPHRLASYTDLPMREAHYFTFLPEFLPQPIVALLGPLERWLERSRLAPFSAHYMAVLQKPA